MTAAPHHVHQPGDGWVVCACGGRHWGLHGAAGLLLHRAAQDGTRPGDVVLQHRAAWSDQGGTWGLPGGALRPGEHPVDGALREAAEEAGIDPAAVQVLTTWAVDHGPWRYTTVVASTTGHQHPRPTDAESIAVAWVEVGAVPRRPLLPAFAAAWPVLRTLLPPPPATGRGRAGR